MSLIMDMLAKNEHSLEKDHGALLKLSTHPEFQSCLLHI